MKSLVGELMKLVNRAPVPYTAETGARSVFAPASSTRWGQLTAMGANGTLFAIVNRTSTSTAAVDWHMHRKLSGRARNNSDAVCPICECPGVLYIDKHPALVVLNKPNNFYTRQELIESGQQHIDLTGEAWLVIDRVGDMPAELWLVRPDRIEVVESRTEFIAGYVYRGPSGEEVPLDRRDVLSIRMPNPMDPYRGMGPVQTLLNVIDSDRFSAEWNRNFFLNNANPGGIVKFNRRMQDAEFREFTARWREQHQGISNAHRVAVLEDGADWVERKYTQRDMQFVEISNLNKDTIRGAFGIPKFAVGDVDDVNRANAEASKAWFAESLTVPRLDRWKGMLNNDFLPQFPMYDPRDELVYASPVPADRDADNSERTSKANAAKTLTDAGYEPEDVLLAVGLPPMRFREKVVAPAPEPVTVGGGDSGNPGPDEDTDNAREGGDSSDNK